MKSLRKILILIVIAAMLVPLLVGCGSKKFKVEHVLMNSIMGGGYLIEGTYQGKTYRLPLNSFEGYKATDLSFASNQVTLTGTSGGYLNVSDGINLNLTDEAGEKRTVFIGEGETFDVIADGDTLKLLLP
jgi:hypothetical protein